MNLSDTPNMAESFCPRCSPERDEVREILIIRWCDDHKPYEGGLDDERAHVSKNVLNTAGEAESEDCRAYADLIHRRRTS